MLPARLCLKGLIFFFRFSPLPPPFVQVCEQLVKGIVYPLAEKSTQVLDLAHQKERMWLDTVPSLYMRAFIISLDNEFQNSV